MSRSQPDHVVGLAGMPALFEKLARQPAGQAVPIASDLKYEVNVASGGRGSMSEMDRIGRRSVLACPDCHGIMWEIDQGELVRYRCHEGHAYTAEIMSLALDDNVRRALASALRALDERTALARKLEARARAGGHNLSADSWSDKAREFEAEAQIIRDSFKRTDEIAAKLRLRSEDALHRSDSKGAAGLLPQPVANEIPAGDMLDLHIPEQLEQIAGTGDIVPGPMHTYADVFTIGRMQK
jgi:two-component system, chemotaxis family, protein-glutamate methylesterase/glutaminase